VKGVWVCRKLCLYLPNPKTEKTRKTTWPGNSNGNYESKRKKMWLKRGKWQCFWDALCGGSSLLSLGFFQFFSSLLGCPKTSIKNALTFHWLHFSYVTHTPHGPAAWATGAVCWPLMAISKKDIYIGKNPHSHTWLAI